MHSKILCMIIFIYLISLRKPIRKSRKSILRIYQRKLIYAIKKHTVQFRVELLYKEQGRVFITMSDNRNRNQTAAANAVNLFCRFSCSKYTIRSAPINDFTPHGDIVYMSFQHFEQSFQHYLITAALFYIMFV